MPRRVAVTWAVPALVLLSTCGLLGLFEPTETRYAEIAREMLASGDWLVPRLNGIAHFHKPPVAYWGAAAGMAMVGLNEWGARIFTALCGGALLAATWLLARRLAGIGVAALTPPILGGMLLFAALSRQLATDVPLAASAAWFWVVYLRARDRGEATPWAAYALLAAGFMIKGPIVFLHTILPLLGVAALGRGRDRVLAPLGRPGGWMLFAVLALPWYVVVVGLHEGLFAHFVLDQVWARYATTIHGRPGPWYYFACVLAAGALPWTLPFVAELTARLRDVVRNRSFETLALVSWAILPVVFFSTAGSKLPAYILPELIPTAILAAAGICRSPRMLGAAAAVSIAGVGLGLEWMGPRLLARTLGAAHAATLPLPTAAHAAAALWLGAAALLVSGRNRAGVWAAWAAALALLFAVAPLESPFGSPRVVARIVARAREPGEPLVEVRDFNAGLPFYLRTEAHLVDVPRDLRFEEGGDHPAMKSGDEIPLLVRRHGRVWVLAPKGVAASLAATLGLRADRVAAWRDQEVTRLGPME